MKIAVASGKGGTGKTTVALALAETAAAEVFLVDCDVEEPNCHLFLPGECGEVQPVTIPLPEFAVASCSGCGDCVRSCRFNALARLGSRVLVFPELCHSCGNCVRRCPENALRETPHQIGTVRRCVRENLTLLSGTMDVGYSMASPVVKHLQSIVKAESPVIFDAPPGISCPMVATVRGCDYALLVTEPTPFGLHDLALAVKTLQLEKIPCGVILNRAGENDELIENFCRKEEIPLLLKIPFSLAVARGYAKGESLIKSAPEMIPEFERLWHFLEAAI